MDESKLIVVVIVLAVILLGLAAFLFYIERRLARSEKQISVLQKKSNDSISSEK
jgi:Tfp pilus assembly protein PilV